MNRRQLISRILTGSIASFFGVKAISMQQEKEMTPNIVISMPSQLFTLSRKFQAASNGKIYVGKINTDPTTPSNQVPVFVANEDGSFIQATQPILINQAGYPVYNGQISRFMTEGAHSMAVYDAYGVQQFYFDNTVKYEDQTLLSLQSPDGFKMIGACNNIDELKNISPPLDNQRVLAIKYYADDEYNMPRVYVWSSSSNAVDNGGTIIQSARRPNGRWILEDKSNVLDARLFGIKPTKVYSSTDTDYAANLIKAMTALGTSGTLHFVLPDGWSEAHYLVHANTDWGKCWLSADAGVVLHAANTNDDEGKKPKLKTDVTFSQAVPNNPIDYGSVRGSNDYDELSAIAAGMAASASINTKTVPFDFTRAASGIKYTALGPTSGITYTYNSAGTTITKDQVYFDTSNQSAYCGVALAASVGSEIEVLVENTGSISNGLIIVGIKALGINGNTSTTLAAHIDISSSEIKICNGTTVVNTFSALFPTDAIKSGEDNGVRAGARVISQNLVALTLNGRVIGTISTSSVFAREFILLVDDNARKGVRFKYGFYRLRDKVNYTKPLTIACLGDSITRGARTSNEWPRLLQNYAEHLPGIGKIKKLTNFGVSGRTLRGFVADIGSLDFKGYDYTLIQLGTNDCQNRGNISQFYNDVITLGNKVIEDGSIPVFAVFPKFTSSSITGNGNATNNIEFIAKYQSVIRWAAESRGWKVVFVDDFFGDNCGMSGDYDNPLKISNSWCHDNIHPNSRGSIAVASAFANALSSVLSFNSYSSMCEKMELTSTSTYGNEVSRGIPVVSLSRNTVTITGVISSSSSNTVIAKIPSFASPTKTIFTFLPYSSTNDWRQARVEVRPNGEIYVGGDYTANGAIELCITYNI